MSQVGMTLPGGRVRRGPSADLYTVLMVVSVVALAAACGFVYYSGMKVAPDGKPWQIQDANRIRLPSGK